MNSQTSHNASVTRPTLRSQTVKSETSWGQCCQLISDFSDPPSDFKKRKRLAQWRLVNFFWGGVVAHWRLRCADRQRGHIVMVKTYIFHRRFFNISHHTNIHLNYLYNYYFVCVFQGGRRPSALYWPAATGLATNLATSWTNFSESLWSLVLPERREMSARTSFSLHLLCSVSDVSETQLPTY